MVVSLPISAKDFTSALQAAFVSGVAAAARVAARNVEITQIVEVPARRSITSRRLLAASVEARPPCQPCSYRLQVSGGCRV